LSFCHSLFDVERRAALERRNQAIRRLERLDRDDILKASEQLKEKAKQRATSNKEWQKDKQHIDMFEKDVNEALIKLQAGDEKGAIKSLEEGVETLSRRLPANLIDEYVSEMAPEEQSWFKSLFFTPEKVKSYRPVSDIKESIPSLTEKARAARLGQLNQAESADTEKILVERQDKATGKIALFDPDTKEFVKYKGE
jgi:hypothetical protein